MGVVTPDVRRERAMKSCCSISQQEQINANRILYDPIAWIHPQRFSLPNGFSSPRCRRIFNDMLLAHFALATGALDYENDNERYLIRHWHRLPEAAFMAACQRYRSSLFRHGLWWKLDSAVRQFALLSLSPCSDDIRHAITLEDIRAASVREMLTFASNVSDAMKTRLPLLFPKHGNELHTSFPVVEQNALLIRMAIQHAERKP